MTEEKKGVKVTGLFVVITSLFISCLLISNIIAGKLITVFNTVLPAAVILFPVTYIFGDILTEVYGFKKARLAIWTGFACNFLMVGVFALTVALPAPSFWTEQNAYTTVLGMTPRIVFASLLAYFAGELCNSVVLSRMKIMTEGRWLWTRTIGSTVVGEAVDTMIFITLAFRGMVPNSVWLQMILAQYVFKVVYEIVITPLTYIAVGWLKKKEGIDTFDRGVSYNPFRFDI